MKRAGGFVAAAALMAAWWVASLAIGSPFLPSPAVVAVRLVALAAGPIWRHLLASLGRVLASVAVAVAAPSRSASRPGGRGPSTGS